MFEQYVCMVGVISFVDSFVSWLWHGCFILDGCIGVLNSKIVLMRHNKKNDLMQTRAARLKGCGLKIALVNLGVYWMFECEHWTFFQYAVKKGRKHFMAHIQLIQLKESIQRVDSFHNQLITT